MKSNARARPIGPALIGLVVLALLAALLLAGCGDSGASLDSLNIPNTEARFIEEAGKGNLEAVRLFVDGGMKIAGVDSPGQKAYAAAVGGKRRGVLAYLRQAGVVSPAEAALRRKNVAYSVEEYLKRAASGDVETVRLFLAAGMNPNALAIDGRSALGLAEKSQRNDMMAVLKTAGATLNPFEGLKKLGLKFDPETFLTVAQKGDLEAVKYFVRAGMVLDTQDRSGLTALAWAVHGDHFEVVKFLLSSGANPNGRIKISGGSIRTRRSLPPVVVSSWSINVALLEAAYHGNEKLARLLRENKAVFMGPELFIAVHQGHWDVIKAILHPGIYQKTPKSHLYWFALRTNKKRIAEELAKLGAREHPKDKFPRNQRVRVQWIFHNLRKKQGRIHPEYARLLDVLSKTKF